MSIDIDLTTLKKPRKDRSVVGYFVATLLVTGFIFYCIAMAYINLLPFMGIVGGNSCPAWLPSTVEEWGRFHLPASYRNLETYCAGMQGWVARAEFDMSPLDVDALVDGSHIEKPLRPQLNSDDPLYNDPKFRQMKSYLFGKAKNRWQWVLIDTSDSSLYHVYFSAAGGS